VSRTKLALLAALAIVASAAAVYAGEYAEQQPQPFAVPDWLYASIAAGVVQGLVTFGAIKVKFDWLFQRLENLERKQNTDDSNTNIRIDALLMHKHHRVTDNQESEH
jgi:hypothetical protein